MKAQYTLPELFLMLRQNWFKIAVASLLLYMFFNRDLSLQVEMNAPGSKLAKQERTGSWQLPEEPLPQASDKLGLLFSGTEEEAASLENDLRKLDEYEIDAFIQRFVDVARVEQEKFGIPASVVLATALYESTAGHRNLLQALRRPQHLPCRRLCHLSLLRHRHRRRPHLATPPSYRLQHEAAVCLKIRAGAL